MNDIVSVVVPLYNVEPYMEKCLDSILGQTYYYLDIILVDDESSDGTAKICDQFAQKDQRIRVFHEQHGGLSAMRNKGIEVAIGKYICFIDGDDFIHSQMIEILKMNLETENADISVGTYDRYMDFNQNTDICDNNCNHKLIFDSKQALFNLYSNDKRVNSGIICDKLYKYSIFDNLRFPLGMCHEDDFLIHHLFKAAKKIVYTDFIVYYYLYRNGSIMSSYDLTKLDMIKAHKDRMEMIKEMKDDKLYEISYRRYLHIIRLNYCAIKRYLPQEKQKCRELKKLHQSSEYGKKRFCAGVIFDFSPFLYRCLNKMSKLFLLKDNIWE